MKKGLKIIFFLIAIGVFIFLNHNQVSANYFVQNQGKEIIFFNPPKIKENGRIDTPPSIAEKIKKEKEELKFNGYIVQFWGDVPDYSFEWKEKILKNTFYLTNTQIKRKFKNVFTGVSIENVSEEKIKEIKKLPIVKRVYPNYQVRAFLNETIPLIHATSSWALGYTGNNVVIAIIDTGIDYTHPMLGGCDRVHIGCKVANGYDFVNGDNDPMDDHGHGTHVAGIAAGKLDLDNDNIYEPENGEIWGVAPDATLFAYKVLDNSGRGWLGDVIAGVEEAVKDHADVISMSLGTFGDPDDPLSQAVDNAVDQGVVVVVASGNFGPYYETILSPGTARKAITVGASDKSDQIAGFSSRGPVKWNGKVLIKPDVLAPGVSVTSSVPTGACEHCDPSGYKSLSGTSMATPHVAGLAALLKQAHRDWTPEIIKMVIRNTADDLGYDIFTQGYGRIDVESAINVTTSPPIAQLREFSYEAIGTIQIYGTATNTTSSFESYSLYYGEGYNPSTWNLICSSSNPVIDGPLCSFDTFPIKDGEYLIKLEVKDNLGKISIDTNLINVNNAEITSPLNNDIYRAGDAIEIRGKIISNLFQNYSLEYGLGANPTDWILITSSTNQVIDGILGIWDTSSINQANFYTIRLTVNYSNGVSFSEYIRNIYLDPTLKEGWPKRINWQSIECPWGEGTCYYSGGYSVPVISDIDNDRLKEIILYFGGYPPKLFVYKPDGSLMWSREVGTVAMSGSNLSPPLVGDIDNDGFNEIIVYALDTQEGVPYGTLYALNHDGSILWSSKIFTTSSIDYLPALLMADLNLDGKKEIVFKGNYALEGTEQMFWMATEQMVIVSNEGNVISRWNLPDSRWVAPILSTPAVGNFDSDPELEIVSASPSERAGYDPNTGEWINEGLIFVYNMDGSVVDGWPITVPGEPFSSPAVGDINGDGELEIVIGLLYASNTFPDERYGGLYAFDKNGHILDGFPVMKGYEFWSSPSLADFDGDGDLEIGVSRLGCETYIIHHDGTLASGWPTSTCWHDYYSTIIGDVNGDNVPDLLTTAGNGIGGGYSGYDCYGRGGVYAWNFDGTPIPGFPKITELDAEGPATIADIDDDGKVELIASSHLDYDFVNNRYKLRNTIYVWELNQNYNREKTKWPMFHHDPQHSGLYGFTALSPKVWRIDKDTKPPYFTNTSTPQIEIEGEYGMKCRWGFEDLPYSELSQENEMDCGFGSPFSCFANLPNLGGDGQKKVYVSCQDDFGNDQTKYQNLDIIFTLDTTAPKISNLNVNKNPITRSDINQDFVITINFSEEMSTETAPTIIFDPDVSIALINCTSTWASTTQYIYSCKIAESNIKTEKIDIVISGAKDLAGNILSDRVVSKFSIDTKKPPRGFYLPSPPQPSQPPPKEEVKKTETEKLMEQINQLFEALISQYQPQIQQIVSQQPKQILIEIPPDFKFEKPIRYRDKGTEVRYLQILLKNLGFYKGSINGVNDLSTLLAVRKFQLTHGLITPQTPKNIAGYVGPATRAKLNEILENLRK